VGMVKEARDRPGRSTNKPNGQPRSQVLRALGSMDAVHRLDGSGVPGKTGDHKI
jgi:hypothetical protein